MQRFRALIKVRVTDPHPRSLPRGIATALHPPDDIKGECQRVRGRGRLRRLWTVPDKGARRCSLGDWRSPRLGHLRPSIAVQSCSRWDAAPPQDHVKDWSGKRILRSQKARSNVAEKSNFSLKTPLEWQR